MPALADDETFLRRVSLDLTGKLPAPEEIRAFLTDKNPDKRARQIYRLLASQASYVLSPEDMATLSTLAKTEGSKFTSALSAREAFRIFGAVREFCDGADQSDDITATVTRLS